MRITTKQLIFLFIPLGLGILYFFLRLYNILALPLFTDEAIYIRWAQIAKQDAVWRFISLVDGKQPSFVWIGMVLLRFFDDPLLAGRMVSVFGGFATAIGLFFLGNEVFRSEPASLKIFSFTKQSVRIGFLSSTIYVIYPFGLVYDRMALYDSLVGTFAVWSLYLLILLVRSFRLDVALIAGLAIGGGVLTKSNGFFSLYSMPFLLALLDLRKKNLKPRLIKFIALCLVVIVLSNAIYAILRLSPFYHIIAEKNALFVYPFSEWVKHPFTYFISNIKRLISWFIIYLTIPGVLLGLFAFFVNKKYFWEKILLVAWFAFPFIILAFFGNTIYPRFILFMTLPLIPLVSYSLIELVSKYKSPIFRFGALVVFAIWLLVIDLFILTNFGKAPIPKEDTGQYFNSWSAGNGVKQSVEFFKNEGRDKKIYIMTQGTFGLMPYGLEMYLADSPNIKIKAVWPIQDIAPDEVLAAARKMPTYAIFYQPCTACSKKGNLPPPLWPLKLLQSFQQGNSDDYYRIYQVEVR